MPFVRARRSRRIAATAILELVRMTVGPDHPMADRRTAAVILSKMRRGSRIVIASVSEAIQSPLSWPGIAVQEPRRFRSPMPRHPRLRFLENKDVDHRDKRGDDIRYVEASWIASLALAMTRRLTCQTHRLQRRLAANEVARFVRDHLGRCVQIGRNHPRHDRSIDHTQTFEAMNPQLVVDHGP